jgi:hypothetical protein
MKRLITLTCLTIATFSLAACSSEEKTTVIHDRPTVVNPTPTASDVEYNCMHGYDNATHSCY